MPRAVPLSFTRNLCWIKEPKTLRGYLELGEKHKIDMLCTFEWDETNENTNIEPTVAKPMANARILKYYQNKLYIIKMI